MKDKGRPRQRYTKGGYPKPKKATHEIKYWTPPRPEKDMQDIGRGLLAEQTAPLRESRCVKSPLALRLRKKNESNE